MKNARSRTSGAGVRKRSNISGDHDRALVFRSSSQIPIWAARAARVARSASLSRSASAALRPAMS
ncbi:MAG: hypothetical protein B7Y85_10690 [Brevundimonas sp. 32-68-21]|nr:MAG: hypothetical protein B7Y85_10690 [Brevundimonas sp. 32-68-21]